MAQMELSTNQLGFFLETVRTNYAVGDKMRARQKLDQLIILAERDALGRLLALEQGIALFCKQQGDPEQAIRILQRSLEVIEITGGANSSQAGTCLEQLAIAQMEMGNWLQALPMLERCLSIREKAQGESHPDFTVALDNLAFCLVALGRFSDALPVRQRLLTIHEWVFGPENLTVAGSLDGVAELHQLRGDFAQALPLLLRSLVIREKALRNGAHGDATTPTNSPSLGGVDGTPNSFVVEVTASLNRLAKVHSELGNYGEALALARRSVALNKQAFGEQHLSTGASLSVEAGIQLSRLDYAEAKTLLQRSLVIFESAFGKEHIRLASILNNLALAEKGVGNATQAVSLFERSLAISEKLLGRDNPLLVTELLNLASAYRDQGNFFAALPVHTRSLTLAEKFFGKTHPSTTLAACHLAIWYIQQGVWPQDLFKRDGVLLSWHAYLPTQLPWLHDQDAFRLVQRYSFISDGLHSLVPLQLKGALGEDVRSGAEGIAWSKALIEEASVIRAALGSKSSGAVRNVRAERDALQHQLVALGNSKLDLTQKELRTAAVRQDLRRLEAAMVTQVGSVTKQLLEQAPPLIHVASALPGNAALVDFVHYRRWDYAAKTDQWKEARYAAYLTFPLAKNSTNLSVDRVDLGEAEAINTAITELHMLFADKRIAPMRLDPVLRRLGALIYAPLARHLTNIAQLIICPDGQLGRLPFELLPVDANGRFLVQDKLITYVSSGREIARLAQPRLTVPTSAPFVMGNPDFNLDFGLSGRSENAPSKLASRSLELGTNSQTLIAEAARNRMRSQDISSRGLKFNPLPGSEREARSVATLLGRDTIVRLGAAARESELKAVVSPSVLHLATHGFFLTDQEFKRTNSFHEPWRLAGEFTPYPRTQEQDWENPLIRCGIALAGANHASSITNALVEDGVLTGLEASLLNLQGTKLVILSACDTGSGDVKIGEGVMSLRRAFTIAGAETVLASHWKVNDEATNLLMTEFIRRWKAGEPRGQAWRQAQLSLLRSKDFSNPYFWAAFTLTGQWR